MVRDIGRVERVRNVLHDHVRDVRKLVAARY
jgi:hypothetical protein